MDNRQETKTEKGNERDWHQLAKQFILLGKLLLVVFLLGLLITATLQYLVRPYSYLVVGLEISIALIASFTIIRMSTFKPTKDYDFDNLLQKKEPVKLLLNNLHYDISRYEAGSSYYFNGVRFYKYSTIILAGLSTIVLGLDLGDYNDIVLWGGMRHTTFAKNIALVIGAIITVTTALMSYWNIEKYWLTNKTILNKLRALRDDVESDFVAGKLSGNTTNLETKIDEYKRIKADFYKYWEGALADRDVNSGQGNDTVNK